MHAHTHTHLGSRPMDVLGYHPTSPCDPTGFTVSELRRLSTSTCQLANQADLAFPPIVPFPFDLCICTTSGRPFPSRPTSLPFFHYSAAQGYIAWVSPSTLLGKPFSASALTNPPPTPPRTRPLISPKLPGSPFTILPPLRTLRV